jgi:hypothetical protein
MVTDKHSQNELEILRLLARGEKEIEAGKGYELEPRPGDTHDIRFQSISPLMHTRQIQFRHFLFFTSLKQSPIFDDVIFIDKQNG